MSSSGEVDKTLLAFLNGLARRNFFGENQFTDEFLRDEVLGNINEDGMKRINTFNNIFGFDVVYIYYSNIQILHHFYCQYYNF